jgi:ring-1,2-phenylacetyl-CoA epoxidase subunit PaaB
MGQPGQILPKRPLDQFGTFEVFVQPKEGKPFQHEGIVHAPDPEMAFILAKEAFTRRFTCNSLYVAETSRIFVSPMAEGTQSVYDLIEENVDSDGQNESYEIYHLLRRGKQHIHAGTVQAANPQHAMAMAKKKSGGKTVLNIWTLRTADIRFTAPEEMDLWHTLPEKKFRDASAYKGGDRLKEYLDGKPS